MATKFFNLAVGLSFALTAFLSIPSTSAGADPRLAAAQEKYKAARWKQVDVPFGIELEKLNRQLDKALAGEEEKAVEQGDLNLVTAFQAERKALADTGEVASGEDGIPAKVKQFRDTWHKEKATIDAGRAVVEKKLLAKFNTELQALEKTLTQERKIKEALAVRKYREGLADSSAPRPPGTKATSGSKGGWINILDGKSLDGWRADIPSAFQVVDGGVMAKKPKSKGNARLYYTGDDNEPDVFRSFEVRIRAHLEGDHGNSGLFFHVPPEAADRRVDGGFEVNIANGSTLANQTGSIWNIKSVKRPIRGQDKTFELLIRVTEDQLTVTYDGREIMKHVPKEAKEKAFSEAGGAIAIQANSNPGAYVFERIDLRRLD